VTTAFALSERSTKSGAATKIFQLLAADRRVYASTAPGEYGGYRPRKVYGRLNCPAALRAIARGGYVRNRVLFADEATAVAAGYRPCAVCLRDTYRTWKRQQNRGLERTRDSGG
jgi:Metal binding domain of Ada